MAEIVMPRLSDSMEEGTIISWLKSNGDQVERGDELVEIETDKATMTYESDQSGVLEIVAEEGATLPIGATIAKISEAGSGDATAEADDKPVAVEKPESPPKSEPEKPNVDEKKTPSQSESETTIKSEDSGDRIKASPLARRMAHDLDVSLQRLKGSGPGGRIVKADVETAANSPDSEPEPSETTTSSTPAPSATNSEKTPTKQEPPTTQSTQPQVALNATAKGEVTTEELSRTQQLIARRMAESKATIPDFSLTIEIDMQAAVDTRRQLKTLSADSGNVSFNDMVVKACALALKRFPRANGAYRDGKFELYERINVGVAVAGEDSLTVPTIFDADKKSLGQIARETKEVVQRVHDSIVTPPELSGGTFTVSNLGMFGITNFNAVINSPQAAILAVGEIVEKPVVVDGQVVIRNRMQATLTCDHRILYGADAAKFLATIKQLLEQPVALTL